MTQRTGMAMKLRLEKAYKEGKLRAIGLSNFPVEKIQKIIDQCEIKPALMQVEGNPWYPAEAVRPYCQEQNCPVPGSRSEGHIKENANIFDFALTDAEMGKIALLNRHTPIYQVTPENLKKLATTKCNFED